MSKKSIEDKFSIDMDAYFNGIEKVSESNDEDYNELLEFGKTLANKDFSESSNKEAVYNKTLKNLEDHKGVSEVKKSNKIRKAVIAAASFVIVCGVFGQTSFAKELAHKVINSISLGNGNIKVLQTQETPKADNSASRPIPDELKGKVFDKNGKPITVFTKGTQCYTADGEEIVGFAGDGKSTDPVTKKSMKEHRVVIKDSSKLNEYACFKVKLPSYLPKDYKFDRAEFIKDKDGNISKQYIDIFFTNPKTSKYIYMQQRASSDETKYVTSTDGKIEKVKINGKDAAISDDRYIDWEADKVLYELSGRGEIKKAELIKIAESIR